MLRLRPYKNCDAEKIIGWIGDEFSFRQWCADRYESYPITPEDMNGMYDRERFSDAFFEMTAFDESGIVGHLTMRFVDEEKTVLRFGFVIVDRERRGQGCGKEMLSLALDYAFDILRVKRVTLGVFENNPAAYRCYKSVGFRETPTAEESYRIFGEEWRCIELEITRPPAKEKP